ncbi:hypothetical protein Elgi_68790 [Paenibacillus elgii]|nr:hypothetical protein Elgi_68790 [Paenibacillus elgii]
MRERFESGKAGYHADGLCYEPLRTTFVGEGIPSFTTVPFSFNDKASFATAKSLERVNEALQGRVYAIQPREQFVLDLDFSSFAASGDSSERTTTITISRKDSIHYFVLTSDW